MRHDDGVTRFGDGLVVGGDLLAAAEQATAQALAPLGGSSPDLVAVFVSGGAPDDVAAVGERVHALARPAAMVGCGAGGVVGGRRGV